MKIVPILVITNAIAFGLLAMLFIEQGDLKSQLKTARSHSRPATVSDAGLEARLEALERMRAGSGAVATDLGTDARVDAPSGEGLPTDGGEAAKDAEAAEAADVLQGERMESFRRNVRKANELNREEDRVTREVDRIARLVEEGKIASMSPAQEQKVAKTLLSYRDQIPEIWRRMRSDPEMREMSWEERRQVMQTEGDALRGRAVKDLEKIISAADAKALAEDSMRDRGRGPSRPRTNRNR
ncbi:MAG: hypothetical protein ACYTGN_00085 [Planctomycetota bacterium]|jgi:hypothetical protein